MEIRPQALVHKGFGEDRCAENDERVNREVHSTGVKASNLTNQFSAWAVPNQQRIWRVLRSLPPAADDVLAVPTVSPSHRFRRDFHLNGEKNNNTTITITTETVNSGNGFLIRTVSSATIVSAHNDSLGACLPACSFVRSIGLSVRRSFGCSARTL